MHVCVECGGLSSKGERTCELCNNSGVIEDDQCPDCGDYVDETGFCPNCNVEGKGHNQSLTDDEVLRKSNREKNGGE